MMTMRSAVKNAKSGSRSVRRERKNDDNEKRGDDSKGDSKSKHVNVKVGMIGESQAGKTSLMVKYVDNKFGDEYIETLGVNFMEKTVKLRKVMVTISLWDIGGQKEYRSMMPLVCSDAKVLLFMFDLTRKQSLFMIREWYKNARRINRFARPFLVGCKFDLFANKKESFRLEITKQARQFSHAMKAPLIYCSSSHSINVKTIFQLILATLFDLRLKVPEESSLNKPIVEYKSVWQRRRKEKEKRRQEKKAKAIANVST